MAAGVVKDNQDEGRKRSTTPHSSLGWMTCCDSDLRTLGKNLADVGLVVFAVRI